MAFELKVGGMKCQNCVNSVKGAVSKMSGVSACNIDLKSGIVKVEGSDIDEEKVKSAILDLGFDVK